MLSIRKLMIFNAFQAAFFGGSSMSALALLNDTPMALSEADASFMGYKAGGALTSDTDAPRSDAAAEAMAGKDAQDGVGLAGDMATPVTDDAEWGAARSTSAKVAPTQAPPVAKLAKEAPPDLVEMIQKITDPGVLDAITVVIAQRKEDLETYRNERVARLIEEAAALGLTDAAKLMSKQGPKTRRTKGTSTRTVTKKEYRLPSGETATRPGRLSNAFKAALAKCEGKSLDDFLVNKAEATELAH